MKSLHKFSAYFVIILFIFGCANTIKTVITSNPPGANIYMGDAPHNMSYVGITPMILEYTNVKPYWREWYYQIKKAGYEESELIFKPQGSISANRYVHATLKPLGEKDAYAGPKAAEDAVEFEIPEEKKVSDTKGKIEQLESKPIELEKVKYHRTKLKNEQLKCVEIQRLSSELESLMTTFPLAPHNFHWDWGTKGYYPPPQSRLGKFSKINRISLKILSLMNELHNEGPEKEIPDCNVAAHLTFCRKATISVSGKGLIDREDARIEYKMTGRAPAILMINFIVMAAPIEIVAHGFSMISESPFITYPSTHVEFRGEFTWFGRRVKATQFASHRGPDVGISGMNMTIEPYFSVPYTVKVFLPKVFFYTEKGWNKGPLVYPHNIEWLPISLTRQALQEALEKGRLILRRKMETESLSGTVTIDFLPIDREFQAPGQSDSGGIGLWGDRTTHGGFLLATGKEVFSDGQPVAKEGDPVLCPIHGLSKVSRDESSGVYIGDKTVAFAGGKADCGAKILSGSPLTMVQPVKQ